MVAVEYHETFRVLGWEEVEVRAGKFKAIKLEYKIELSLRGTMGWFSGTESKAWYWYSPEVKNFVKCQYEKDILNRLVKRKERGEIGSWFPMNSENKVLKSVWPLHIPKDWPINKSKRKLLNYWPTRQRANSQRQGQKWPRLFMPTLYIGVSLFEHNLSTSAILHLVPFPQQNSTYLLYLKTKNPCQFQHGSGISLFSYPA